MVRTDFFQKYSKMGCLLHVLPYLQPVRFPARWFMFTTAALNNTMKNTRNLHIMLTPTPHLK